MKNQYTLTTAIKTIRNYDKTMEESDLIMIIMLYTKEILQEQTNTILKIDLEEDVNEMIERVNRNIERYVLTSEEI